MAAVVAAAGFHLRIEPGGGDDFVGRSDVLSQVIELAESLPFRPLRRLPYPPFAERVR